MDTLTIVRTLGALVLVLGLMATALWAVRRYDIRLPGRVGGGALRRMELVEKTALDPRRSVALLRRDGREHLILIAPEGNMIIETGIVRDAIDLAAEAERQRAADAARAASEAAMAETRAELKALSGQFAQLVDGAAGRLKDRAGSALGEAKGLAGLVLHGPEAPAAEPLPAIAPARPRPRPRAARPTSRAA